MEFGRSGSLVRFTHSEFTSEGEAMAQIETLFPTAANAAFAPLSLRSIFLANARTHRVLRTSTETGVGA
jgi:hypothetical protein